LGYRRTTAVDITDLDGRSVDFELLEDGKRLLEQLTGDGDVGNIWCIVVIQTVDVFHHSTSVSLDSRENKQVL